MTDTISALKDAYVHHNRQYAKLEMARIALVEICTSHDHPAWKHVEAISKERDEHYRAYQEALDGLIEATKDDFDDSTELDGHEYVDYDEYFHH